MRALNQQTGAVLWTRTTPLTIDADFVATNGLIYTTTQYPEQGMLVLDGATGATRWQRKDVRAYGYGPPAVTANAVLATGVGTTTIAALNALTGATKWSKTIADAQTNNAPVVANGIVYVGSRGNPKAVYAFRLDNGATLATLSLGTSAGNYDISPIVVGGTILASVVPDFGTPTVPTLSAFRPN